MNEFISNSGTLINPDSAYDQERFINRLQIILQKKTQKELHLLVHHGLAQDECVKVITLLGLGQLAVKQQVAGVKIVATGGYLLNRVATVEQLAFVAVNVGNGRLA